MTNEMWIAFGAASIFIALLPSPLASLIARYAVQRGRRTALLTVPGAAIGLTVTLTIAALPIGLVAWAVPGLLAPLSWLGMGYLMLYVLWAFQEPSARSPFAHNDNLPEQQSLHIFAYLLTICLRSSRYVLLLAALLVQFFEPAMLTSASLMMEMQLTFMAFAAAGSMLHAAFPQRTLNRLRPKNMAPPASHKLTTRFIARRAVTAGYRRIAA